MLPLVLEQLRLVLVLPQLAVMSLLLDLRIVLQCHMVGSNEASLVLFLLLERLPLAFD